MINKTLTVIFLSVVYAGWFQLNAQTVHRCATRDIYEYNVNKNPGYASAVENAFNYAKEYANKTAAYKSSQTWDTIYRIPVVVHVVYHNAQQNIPDSLIYNQIEVLNQDYRRTNSDTANTRSFFKPVAADAGIEFILASTDPQGNPTSGITRDSSSRAYFSLFGGGSQNGADEVKSSATGGVDAWDTEKYLNIWVCNLEDPTFPLGAILGFAYPPDNAPNWPQNAFPADPNLHGVVVHYKVFGRNNPLAIGDLAMANRGRTAVHEVGHYLGLRHIWGDGPLSILFPDCSVDDGIDDTPNSGNNSQLEASTAVNCNISKNTCTDPVDDLPDMWENYMDYSTEECQNMFTFGQVAVMRAMLATSRSELPEIILDSLPVASVLREAATFDFTIAPNPSHGIVEMFFPEGKERVKITINDLVGKTWGEYMIEGKKKSSLNLSDLPKGMYAVTAYNSDRMAVRKIVLN